MKFTKTLRVCLFVFVIAMIGTIVWRSWPPSINKANAERINVGMNRGEVEAILGRADGNYSSIIADEHYIWKGKDGWIYVYLKQSKVTEAYFSPIVRSDDP